MDPWNFMAPSSGNIINSINSEEFTEKYFEIDHEGVCQAESKQKRKSDGKTVKQVKIKQEILSPVQQDVVYEVTTESPPRNVVVKTEMVTPQDQTEEMERRQTRRRSMSVCAVMETTNMVSHVTDMSHGIQKIHLTSVYENRSIHDVSSSKSVKSMSTTSSHTNLSCPSTKKFVSMAEAIYHLQKDTPERFHSYSKKQENRPLNAAKNFQRKLPCIPHSPALLSKTRNRNIKILSQKELEDMEYEEVKNYKIKANPIPKAVICGSTNFPNVERRPPTRPMPFNLTQIRKKPPQPEKKIVFSAKPVPKYILEKPAELPKKTVHVTIPQSPNFTFKGRSRSLENLTQQAIVNNARKNQMNKGRNPLQVSMDSGLPDQGNVGHSGVPLGKKVVTHPCKPKPFSFEKRDKEMMRRKEEKIQMVFEEEKKMREFHANPLPNVIKKSKGMSPKPRLFEKKNEHKKENKENECEEEHKVFKARPPVVLFKSPFKPIRKERPVLEPCQVQLSTEIRSQKREEFNQALKEKELQVEELRRRQEEERRQREEEEKAAIRAQLVHKAAPVRHYAPLVIHPSEVPLTRPESPKFQSGKV